MMESYQISTHGVMDGYCKEQVTELLMILFKRNKEDIEPILDANGYLLKRGINLATALRYKGRLEQRGCKCSVEKIDDMDTLAADFPDTVMLQTDSEWALMHDTVSNPATGLKISQPMPVPAQRQARPEVLPSKSELVDMGRHVATNEIGTTVQDDPFFVQTPQSMCCNCGTTTGLSTIATPYVKHVVFSPRRDTQRQIELALPYCPTCADNVGKYPISSALQWLIGFCIWLLVLTSLAFTFNLAQKTLVAGLLVTLVALILALLAVRWIGKPTAPMTTKFTPVIIKEYVRNPNSTRRSGRAMWLVSTVAPLLRWVDQKRRRHDPDKINRITMQFSNPAYAKSFRKANQDFVRSGYIKIV